MDIENPVARAFLFEVYTKTQGDTNAQVSMYDVGEALGIEKADAGATAEELFIQGFAELKTLSGGIGITPQGLDVLKIKIEPKPDTNSLSMGPGPILEDPGQKTVEKIIQDVKLRIAPAKQTYAQLEEMVMDIKTIETQMLSPHPKTEVIREVFRSLHASLASAEENDLAAKLKALITS